MNNEWWTHFFEGPYVMVTFRDKRIAIPNYYGKSLKATRSIQRAINNLDRELREAEAKREREW